MRCGCTILVRVWLITGIAFIAGIFIVSRAAPKGKRFGKDEKGRRRARRNRPHAVARPQAAALCCLS